MDGFTFAGVHSSVFGVHHNPSPASRGGDMEDYSVESLDWDSRDGGYYAGICAQVRTKE